MTGDIFDEVRSLAAGILAVDAATLDAESSPERVESWDSVQHLTLVLALEEKYEVEFGPTEMDQMRSLGEIARLLTHKMQAN